MSGIGKKLGPKITEARLSLKLTQSQLAEKVDVSVETISRIERGVSFPSLKTIEKIAVVLKVPLKTLFEFESDQSRNQRCERELAKLIGCLRTLDNKDIKLIHEILKMIYKKTC